MATEYNIQRLDDRSLFRLFEKAKKDGKTTLDAVVDSLAGSNHEISTSYGSGLPWEITDEDLKSAKPGQYTLGQANLTFSIRVTESQNRTRNEQITFAVIRNNKGTLMDTFRLTPTTQLTVMNSVEAQLVQKALHKTLSSVLQPVAPEDGGLIPTLSNLAQAFDSTYRRISDELSTAVTSVSKERTEQLTEFQAERKRLREEIANERSEFLREARQKIHDERAELALERHEIDEAWKKLEVSSHKDARRKQFSKLQEDLQNALKEPVADQGLRATRWAVFWALLASGMGAAFFAYSSISSQPGPDASTASWLFPAIRSLVLTFASLASFLGAAAWLRYFYVRDLQAQEELRRFRNDMARASWVMDAALEIRKEHNEDIPPEWIMGVTEGLFSAKKKDTLEEGAQALAALMGLSASASFGPSGTTVELGRKGGKAISAAAQGND